MADNSTQGGADTIRDKDRAGVKTQIVGLDVGIGTATEVLLSTANPLPVNIASSAGNGAQSSQSLAAAGAASLAGTTSTSGSWVIDVGSAGNVSFHLLAAAFVGVVTFEQSFDPAGANGTWAPVPLIPEDGLSAPATTLSINTAVAYVRQFTQGMFGPKWFRVRVSTYTSGTLVALGSAGPGWVEGQPALAPSLATIGTVLPRPADLQVTTTAAISIGATLTLPAPGAGLFHYITSLKIQRYAAAALTGAATPVLVTSTNLPGSPVWSIATVGAIGTQEIQYETYPQPLRSSVANTATTIVAPVYTNAIWRLSATYYTGV